MRYRDHLEALVQFLRLPREAAEGGAAVTPPENAPTAMVFAPHPDDESITGALPLRLRREAGWRVVDVAMTLGSDRANRGGRRRELHAACAHLGFELVEPVADGFSDLNPTTRSQQPERWQGMADAVARLLREVRPALVVMPHAEDQHPTHIGTHHVVMDALALLGADAACLVAQSEYWRPLANPNVMLGVGVSDLDDLMQALACHQGEVARNPFHLRLPGWMIDNVRRGAELVGGFGEAAPAIAFATLYRLDEWRQGALHPWAARIVPAGVPVTALWPTG